MTVETIVGSSPESYKLASGSTVIFDISGMRAAFFLGSRFPPPASDSFMFMRQNSAGARLAAYAGEAFFM